MHLSYIYEYYPTLLALGKPTHDEEGQFLEFQIQISLSKLLTLFQPHLMHAEPGSTPACIQVALLS